MAGMDADNTLHFPTRVTGQIFWNGVLLWPLAPPVPIGATGAAAAPQATLQAAMPNCGDPLSASEVSLDVRSALCHSAPTPSQYK